MYEVFNINQISWISPYSTSEIKTHINYTYEWIKLNFYAGKKDFYTENRMKENQILDKWICHLSVLSSQITLMIEIMIAIKINKFNINAITF